MKRLNTTIPHHPSHTSHGERVHHLPDKQAKDTRQSQIIAPWRGKPGQSYPEAIRQNRSRLAKPRHSRRTQLSVSASPPFGAFGGGAL